MVYCYTTTTGERICESTSWNNWGRWVAIGILIAASLSIIIGFVLFAVLSSRRRRRRGLKPLYGTSWAAGPPPAYAPEDPHPEITAAQKERDLELDDSPAPSYREATSSSNRSSEHLNATRNVTGSSIGSHLNVNAMTPEPTGSTIGSVNVATVAVAARPEMVGGAGGLREPGRVADPDGRREF